MFAEFKEFIARGNAIDLAVGVVLGAAFGAIVTSLVNDIVMPLAGLLIGGADFAELFVVLKDGVVVGPYATLAAAQEAGAVTLAYGLFINAIVSFLLVGVALFMMVKAINKLRRPPGDEAPSTRDCPFCLTAVPIAATKCPACTSSLETS
ncbi:MAG: large conductance mechanosensitive channel protein MscL [Coriobacteriia bacterium]|nr:large conductance mechanosensitive channel protein MscL [Coriobacteriia bacterium]